MNRDCYEVYVEAYISFFFKFSVGYFLKISCLILNFYFSTLIPLLCNLCQICRLLTFATCRKYQIFKLNADGPKIVIHTFARSLVFSEQASKFHGFMQKNATQSYQRKTLANLPKPNNLSKHLNLWWFVEVGITCLRYKTYAVIFREKKLFVLPICLLLYGWEFTVCTYIPTKGPLRPRGLHNYNYTITITISKKILDLCRPYTQESQQLLSERDMMKKATIYSLLI